MNWIVARMKWIMIISGVLTCTMVYATIAPEKSMESTFGESLTDPLAKLIVRNWGVLITLVGGMLIYGAFKPPFRPLILTVAGLGKVVFIALILAHGAKYLQHGAALAVGIDSAMVIVFIGYLIIARE